MKKINIYLTIICLCLMTVSCKSQSAKSNDKADDPNTAAVYVSAGSFKEQTTEVSYTNTLTFSKDGSWLLHSTVKMQKNIQDADCAAGTWTGDVTADGEVTLTKTKVIDNDTGKLADWTRENAAVTVTISDGKLTYEGAEYSRKK